MPDPSFSLDPRLDADTFAVGELGLCTVRLIDDARFPWLILVPKRAGASELIDLSDEDAALLTGEIRHACRVLRDFTVCHKLNVAALGNAVRQLHIHVIARFQDDVAWPRPVWGVGDPASYDPATADTLITRLRAELGCA